MVKIKDYTNSILLAELIIAAFSVCKHDSKAAVARLDKLVLEMAKRLQISELEAKSIMDRL